MNHPVVFIDQTVDEGVRQGVSASNVLRMIETLRELRVDVMDVEHDSWRYCRLAITKEFIKEHMRARIQDRWEELYKAQQRGFHKVVICYTHFHGAGLGATLCSLLAKARYLEMDASLQVNNASALSVSEIASFWPFLSRIGVKSLIYSDGDSKLDPLITYKTLNDLQKRISCELEFHAHNAYGLATANALAALRAGIRTVATSVAGVGENGHAALEEVIMASKHLMQANINTAKPLAKACVSIMKCLGVKLSVNKAIIGRDIFAHESGIHVDGVAKNPQIYEAFAPEEVGLARQLIIGKHSGTASLKAKFLEWNVRLTEAGANLLLKEVRRMAVKQKFPLSDAQLKQLYCEKISVSIADDNFSDDQIKSAVNSSGATISKRGR